MFFKGMKYVYLMVHIVLFIYYFTKHQILIKRYNFWFKNVIFFSYKILNILIINIIYKEIKLSIKKIVERSPNNATYEIYYIFF